MEQIYNELTVVFNKSEGLPYCWIYTTVTVMNMAGISMHFALLFS